MKSPTCSLRALRSIIFICAVAALLIPLLPSQKSDARLKEAEAATGRIQLNNVTLNLVTPPPMLLLPPPCTPQTGLIISEFRFRGAAGPNDEFIELYNATDTAITVCTADGSTGWAVAARNAAATSAGTVFIVPNGTVIPARGHYLGVNNSVNGYSLGSYPAGVGTTATGDTTYPIGIDDNSGIALFNTANSASFSTSTRLDAIGFSGPTGAIADLYREGVGYPPIGTTDGQYTLMRRIAGGFPVDANDNATDLWFLSTTAGTFGGSVGSGLGAPGPENLSSPVIRNSVLPMVLLDTTVASSVVPNRLRDTTSDPANNSTFGTMAMRRRVVNTSGAPVTRLRFHITAITTYPPPNGTTADLRLRSSSAITVTNVNDAGTCAATGTPSTPPCTVTVQGTTVEEPPAQPMGGGLNTTATVALPQPLAAGASINVQFLLGLQQTGGFSFFLNCMGLPAGSPPAAPSGLSATAASNSQINLAWTDNSNDETGFKIERKTGAGGTYAEIGTVGANVNSYSSTGLLSNTQYFYRVRATNSSGDSAYSAEANATTGNLPPSVSLTAPTNGQVFPGPADNITLTATASDPDGTISKVQFFRGGTTLIGEDTTAPYSFNWSSIAVGTYSLTAKAFDNSGATTTSAAVSITVNSLPSVVLTSPALNQIFSSPANITLTASASDPDGTISKVQFFQGATLLNEDSSAPYSFAWNNVPVGNYSLTAKAFDNLGGTTTSPVITIIVNTAPSVSITSPTHPTTLAAPATFTITATASDPDGSVVKVEFFAGVTLLGEDTTAPYSWPMNNVGQGVYSLTAKATDNGGRTTTSSAVSVVVNTLPNVSITSPTHPTTLLAPANFTINATASDPDGSITKVEFFAGAGLLGEDTTAPYSWPMNNVSRGVYSLTAKATDNNGGTKTSSLVSVVVTDAPTTSISGPVDNVAIPAGSNIIISAFASDDNSVAKVEFFQNGIKLGEDTMAPYEFPWNSVPQGTYSLTTRAIDNHGFTGTSAPVTIFVGATAFLSRLDPKNETGGGSENPLSRNYNWSVPLISLAGRAGLDLGLTLSYNSLVWTRTGNLVTFNDDGGFPSPGFRLGFPVIQGQYFNSEASKNAYLLITTDGSRIELRQIGSSTLYESVDSSHLLWNSATMMLRTINGMQFSYAQYGGEFKCTQIKDRNGNYITITYLSDGRINTVVDTVGRTLNFNYSQLDNTLVTITQSWGGTPHVWASFNYTPTTVQTGFVNVTKVGPPNGTTVKTLKIVWLNDGSRFEFDYTSWIQVSKISNYAADGHLLNYRSYNLPATGATQLDDCPRFSERRDWAENFNRTGALGASGLPSGAEAEVVTGPWTDPAPASWTLPDGTNESGVVVQMTLPDGTYNKVYFAGAAGTATGWKRGLPSMVETYGKTTPDQPTEIKQRSKVTTWTQDNENVAFLLNPRMREMHVYDFDGSGQIRNHARTQVTYVLVDFGDGTSCRLPQDTFEYQANATTVLRRTHTDYHTPAGAYITARVVGLPSEIGMYEVNPSTGAETLMTRNAFAYDEPGSIVGTDAPVQHDNTNYGAGFVVGRGNLTSVTRYNVVNGQSTITRAKYDTAGSTRATIDPLDHQVNVSYADSFSDGINRNTLAYATSFTDADGFTTTTQYNFDHGMITRTQTPPPGINTVGPIKKFSYDSKTQLEQITIEINGNPDYSHTRFVYPDSQNRIDSYTTIETGQGEALAVTLLDGHGRAFAKASVHPGSTGGYSAKLMLFDNLGRTIKESNPTETNLSGSYFNWPATGDDVGWAYTSTIYDWNNRPLTITNPAGKSKTASYDGCGCAGGDVITLTDEVGRRRKLYSDVLGRRSKTEVLNTDGSVYSAAVNTYNARDQLTLVRQWSGPENGGGIFQDTSQSYDGYGRLESKHLPQQNAGTATIWTYNADDTLNTVTDARGASATYIYNNGRHLVNTIQYNAPAGVAGTSTASFAYDAAGNRTSMSDGMGSQGYSYDQLSRITSETRTFTGVAGSFMLSYDYNLASELKSITDPTNSTINYNFDSVGRLSGITGSNNLYGGIGTYASSFSYRASGMIKGLTYGNNYTMSASYDSVLRPTQFKINQPSGQDVIKNDYTYYDDGSPKFMHDWLDERFDRAYGYDHRTMLKEAFSGSEARDFVNNTTTPGHTGPYRQSYQYDAFGNMTRRDNRFWSQNDVYLANYVNHRRTEPGYVYDADGNLLQDPDVTYAFDAAGNNVSLNSPAQGVGFTTSFDGDGQMVKKVETSFSTTVATTLYLRSSVLGGRVITELNAQGQKQVGYVFAGGEVLARQVNGIVAWQHLDPLTGSRVDSNSDGTFDRISQLDPMGVDVGFFDPFILCCNEPPSPEIQRPFLLDGFGIPDGRCTLDGMAIDCGWAFQLMDRGAAVQCPNNDCGPRVMNTFDRNGNFLGRVLSQPFQAFADGFSGFLPPGARYEGQGTWVIPGARASEPPSLKPGAPRPGAGRENRNPDNIGDDEGGGGDIFGQIGATPQNYGTNPFPTFNKDDFKVVDDAIKAAAEMTDPKKHKGCDEALKAFGIPSLNALVQGLKPNGNVYDGRTSTLTGPIGKKGATQSVGDYFKEKKADVGAAVFPNSMTGRGSVTFLGDYFFNPVTMQNVHQQRAIMLIHEAVHQVGGKGDAVFGTSKKLSEKIIEKCFPVLKGKLGGVG